MICLFTEGGLEQRFIMLCFEVKQSRGFLKCMEQGKETYKSGEAAYKSIPSPDLEADKFWPMQSAPFNLDLHNDLCGLNKSLGSYESVGVRIRQPAAL
jgi:hypothetical protein